MRIAGVITLLGIIGMILLLKPRHRQQVAKNTRGAVQ
jgi:hypothetical protein